MWSRLLSNVIQQKDRILKTHSVSSPTLFTDLPSCHSLLFPKVKMSMRGKCVGWMQGQSRWCPNNHKRRLSGTVSANGKNERRGFKARRILKAVNVFYCNAFFKSKHTLSFSVTSHWTPLWWLLAAEPLPHALRTGLNMLPFVCLSQGLSFVTFSWYGNWGSEKLSTWSFPKPV